MSRFSYTAVLETGQRVAGTLRCRDRHEAIAQLLQRGYHPLSVRTGEEEAGSVSTLSQRLFHRITVSDLAVFTRQMASLLKAGLPMTATLSTLRRQCDHPRLARIIQDIEERLTRDGGTLAEALDDHSSVFDAVYRGLVRAGEEGGNLVEVLGNLAKHLSQSAKLKGQVIGAFIYPIFLSILGTAAVFVLMTFVIPKFQELFASFGGTLPLPTRILIAVSRFMAGWWWAMLAGILIALLLGLAALRRRPVRQRIDRVLLRLPILGPMFLKLEISRISNTLAALLHSGVRILEALRITGDTARNLAVRGTFDGIGKAVAGGEPLAEAVGKTAMYPPLVVNLIRTGEDTGELSEMLVELSAIYEDEAQRAVSGAVKLLEPLLICVMGGIIAAIVAAVILPILRANVLVG
jgi:type II secretory pathway component PulF